jgi:hypothetical protein
MLELMLPIFARGPQTLGDLAWMIAVLGGLVAYIGYVGLSIVLAFGAGVAEGIALTCALMLALRKRVSHWCWRPLLWCVGFTVLPVAGMAANFALWRACNPDKTDTSWSGMLGKPIIPAAIGLPFLLALLVIAGLYVVRGGRELFAHGSSSAAGPGRVQVAAASVGKRALAWIAATVGKLLMTAALIWAAMTVYSGAIITEMTLVDRVLWTLIMLLPSVVVGANAVFLWWVAREGGRLHPLAQPQARAA